MSSFVDRLDKTEIRAERRRTGAKEANEKHAIDTQHKIRSEWMCLQPNLWFLSVSMSVSFL